MKNTMTDLHNHLMARIEALGDEDLDGDNLERELKRSHTTANVAGKVIENVRLAFDVDKHLSEFDREAAGSVVKGFLPQKNGNHG